eukprot:CAMPEP_0116946342 /NCGR_PEP_ID=MMETSP0467-20121206/36919_1 /TAXON_ID=283647 /ORGANISM="Mesodinium pulex, Strain SPMC105" /LENGTH=173 /DNA_ID=CAMNT_0004630083 /DNA_START=282 /DNA_END=803 /DNA_ORIENTATION=-
MQTLEKIRNHQRNQESNCDDVLESDDYSNLRGSSELNNLRESREAREKERDLLNKELSRELNPSLSLNNRDLQIVRIDSGLDSRLESSDVSWDLSGTNKDLEKMQVRDVANIDPTRFATLRNSSDLQSPEHDNPLSQTLEESYAVVRKLDSSRLKVKVCTGPVSDELCPTLLH